MRSGGVALHPHAAPRRHAIIAGASHHTNHQQRTSTADPSEDLTVENCRALVLDGAFRPLGIVNWHRAVTLDVLKDVEVLEYYDCFVKTVREDYPIPAVLRSEFIMKGFQRHCRVPLSRKNVMKRDRHRCVYCGSEHHLTIDHVVPVSLGGKSSWENMVTACKHCNNRKSDRSLEQLGWKLRTPPKEPRSFDLHFKIDVPLPRPKEWQHYIGHLDKESEYVYL